MAKRNYKLKIIGLCLLSLIITFILFSIFTELRWYIAFKNTRWERPFVSYYYFAGYDKHYGLLFNLLLLIVYYIGYTFGNPLILLLYLGLNIGIFLLINKKYKKIKDADDQEQETKMHNE